MFYHNWGTTCNPYMTYNCEMSEMNIEIVCIFHQYELYHTLESHGLRWQYLPQKTHSGSI